MNKLKMLVLDVDGTLTNGNIYIGSSGEIMKAFNVKDGYAIANILPELGIIPVIITGRNSEIVKYRAKELGITELYQGIHNKVQLLEKILEKYEIEFEQVAYIGDDLNDLDCIQKCGFTGCPSDAIDDVKNAVNYICHLSGGEGAVREFIDYIKKGI